MRNREASNYNRLLWNNLDLIQSTVGLSSEQLAKNIGLHPLKFEFLKTHHQELPFKTVHSLANNLGFGIDQMLSEQLDAEVLKENFKSYFISQVPVQYRKAYGSRSFTVRNLLKLARKYGLETEVCAHFAIDGLAFQSSIDFPISVQLASDLLDYIAARVSLTEEDYRLTSRENTFHFKDSEFGRSLSKCRSVIEIYEKLLEVFRAVEENWNYSIEKSTAGYVIINCHPNEKIADVYQRIDYSSYNLTKFRVSMAAQLPEYIGLAGTKPSILKSVHQGSSFCQFKFDTSDLRPIPNLISPCRVSGAGH